MEKLSQAYSRDLNAHAQVVDRETEIEIARRARAGCKRARDALITANLKFVLHEALQFCGGFDPDLIQEGNLGLLEAADRFDPERGVRFSTYAQLWIKGAISEAIRKRNFRSRLNVPLDDDERDCDLVDYHQPSAESTLIGFERVAWLRRAIAATTLNSREREILYGRLLHDDPSTLKTFSDAWDVSRERARQIEAKVLEKLRLVRGLTAVV
jgi:RNA polymerase sigma factor (sigma-70 family)